MHGVLRRSTLVGAIVSLALVAAVQAAGSPPGRGDYLVTPLVGNVAGSAHATDPNLVNGWGLARSATSPWWVADNGPDPSTSKSTLYTAAGAINPLVVSVPGGPTGTVFTGIAGNFQIGTTATTTLAPSNFVFATESGQILAWRGGSTAALVTPADGGPDAVYKGLTLATPPGGGPLLYATDFHNGRVDVFDGTWANVTPPGSFVDPNLPKGYAPFGIQAIGSNIFVTYGDQDAAAHDEIDKPGRGIVDEYDLQGNLVATVARHNQLDAPWGVAMAPATFGRYGGDLLVGNFGDGEINAYSQGVGGNWRHEGTLRLTTGRQLSIDGLWGLYFGNAGSNGTPNQLFFAAGPDDESNGLFGMITAP
jgi:uncharacterized protein (TIGR03118 family)